MRLVKKTQEQHGIDEKGYTNRLKNKTIQQTNKKLLRLKSGYDQHTTHQIQNAVITTNLCARAEIEENLPLITN